MCHRVQSDGGRVADRKVHVDRPAFRIRGAAGKRTRNGAAKIWKLADKINRSARRAAPGERRTRALHDLHLLEIERITGLRSEISNSVYINVVPRAEAPYGQIVSRRCSTLAGRQSDSRHVIEHIAKRGGTLLLDDFF